MRRRQSKTRQSPRLFRLLIPAWDGGLRELCPVGAKGGEIFEPDSRVRFGGVNPMRSCFLTKKLEEL